MFHVCNYIVVSILVHLNHHGFFFTFEFVLCAFPQQVPQVIQVVMTKLIQKEVEDLLELQETQESQGLQARPKLEFLAHIHFLTNPLTSHHK